MLSSSLSKTRFYTIEINLMLGLKHEEVCLQQFKLIQWIIHKMTENLQRLCNAIMDQVIPTHLACKCIAEFAIPQAEPMVVMHATRQTIYEEASGLGPAHFYPCCSTMLI